MPHFSGEVRKRRGIMQFSVKTQRVRRKLGGHLRAAVAKRQVERGSGTRCPACNLLHFGSNDWKQNLASSFSDTPATLHLFHSRRWLVATISDSEVRDHSHHQVLLASAAWGTQTSVEWRAARLDLEEGPWFCASWETTQRNGGFSLQYLKSHRWL